MKTTVATLITITVGLLIGSTFGPVPARAADKRYLPNVERVLPFPRSERAGSVWASGACWRGCGSVTTWNLAACLEHDSQGHCLKRADADDRSCQRACRTSGGPLLPIDF